ncbi:MAG: polysaccharide deacetylase family protein [Deltaproteobacteria bacterium HGW-Deltaproteobacteria-21]|nr:MAG: polysaccharide deacetylase family protein [Deltaproteobacteria bacterium HGW-Deltaproteobacteria-21]
MKDVITRIASLSKAEKIGLVSMLSALLLTFVDVRLSAIPLGAFLLSCIVCPFFPRSSFFLPVISRGVSGQKAVALTFDDGPDPLSTPELLSLLLKHGAQATFFVTGKRALAYPEVMNDILRQGHAVGNHTYSHDCLFALRSTKRLSGEIESTQDILTKFGIKTLAFRPPVGITNPRLRKVLRQRNAVVIGFSCRPLDWGNRRIRNLSTKILKRVRPDDIVLLHDIRPKEAHLLPLWLKEIETILSGLEAKGIAILPLSDLIGRQIMMKAGSRQQAVGSKQ